MSSMILGASWAHARISAHHVARKFAFGRPASGPDKRRAPTEWRAPRNDMLGLRQQKTTGWKRCDRRMAVPSHRGVRDGEVPAQRAEGSCFSMKDMTPPSPYDDDASPALLGRKEKAQGEAAM